MTTPCPDIADPSARRVVVTGAGGQLGGYLRRALAAAGWEPVGLADRPGDGVAHVVDVADRDRVRDALARARPAAIVHAAAFTDVDGCERDPVRAEAVNAAGSRHVAEAAREVGAHLVAVGTDFVFSGDGGAPYDEGAQPAPLSVYGATKLAGERAVLAIDPSFAVARTAWLYGGPGKHFPRTVLNVIRQRGRIEVVTDEVGNPTFAGDLAGALVGLLAAHGAGVFHLVNDGQASRFELARAVAAAAGVDPEAVVPTTTADFLAKYPLPARRPANSCLVNRRAAAIGVSLRPWRSALAAYVPALVAELAPVRTSL